MSHRVIEKRRRDRMNNCLADLSRLIPAEYMKKGRGRVEKTEIIEMAIKHMKYLQSSGTFKLKRRCPYRTYIYIVAQTIGLCTEYVKCATAWSSTLK